MKIYLFPKRRGEKVGKKTPSFDLINLTAVRGCSYAEVRTNEQARSDASNACPLHLLCKCGVPAYRFRAVEQLTLVVAPGLYWRKGLLRFWLAAGFYTKGLLHLIAVFIA